MSHESFCLILKGNIEQETTLLPKSSTRQQNLTGSVLHETSNTSLSHIPPQTSKSFTDPTSKNTTVEKKEEVSLLVTATSITVTSELSKTTKVDKQ